MAARRSGRTCADWHMGLHRRTAQLIDGDAVPLRWDAFRSWVTEEDLRRASEVECYLVAGSFSQDVIPVFDILGGEPPDEEDDDVEVTEVIGLDRLVTGG